MEQKSENGELDNTTPEEHVTIHSGWRFSYPIGVDRDRYKARPEIYDLNEKWMESAREFELYEMSCNYAAPRVDRQPHTLLIKELITLLQCPDAVTRAKANLYLREWLVLHPPVTPDTVKLYSDAFRLNPDTCLIDTIKLCMENKDQFIAVWFAELCVLMFQINFNHCLEQGSVRVLKSCMVSQWLWVRPDSVFHSGPTSQLLSLLEDVIISPQTNVPLCVALCSLVSIAAECVRLASVQWNPEDPNFVADPALALAHDLAKRIQHCLGVRDFDTAALVISSVKPCWLRTLVIAAILSSYNDCLLSEKINVNKISLSSIVSQYFFLVPPLQDSRFTERSLMTATSSNQSGESRALNEHSMRKPKRKGQLKSSAPSEHSMRKPKRKGQLKSSAPSEHSMRKTKRKGQLKSSAPSEHSMRKPKRKGQLKSSAPSEHSMRKPKRNGQLKSILNASKVNKKKIPHGESLVHVACKKNNVEKLQQLLAVPGVDVNLKDNNGWTPLHDACKHGSYDCVMQLLNYAPNATTSSASEQENPTARKVDLNAVGGDFNAKNSTPLMEAVEWNHVEICRQLIKYGGKQLLNAKNKDGWTALDLASTTEMREVLNGVKLSASILEPGLGSSQVPFSKPMCIDIQSTHETAPFSKPMCTDIQSTHQTALLSQPMHTDIQSTHQTALLSSLNEKVIGAKYVLKKDCNDFLSLLTSLVSSYYMTMSSRPSSHEPDDLHERDISAVPFNMKDQLTLLKRHIKRLTRKEDYTALIFQMELLELVCLSKL